MADGGSDSKPLNPPQSSPTHASAPQPQGQPQAAGPSPAEHAQVKKAREYLDQAQKRLSSAQGFLGKLFG